MTKKKVLLVGNHSCSNRGDMAILRGLTQCLQQEAPELELTVLSRDAEASNVLFELHPLEQDPLTPKRQSLKSKIFARVFMTLNFAVYFLWGKRVSFALSKRQKRFCELLDKHDFVIHVGGSFFVDHYGIGQFEYILLSLLSKKNIYLLGHSYGPFRSLGSKVLAKKLLSDVKANFYREGSSLEVLKELGVSNNLKLGADTAWLVSTNNVNELPKQTVAFTLRDLYPFSADLGVTQDEFEANAAVLINKIINAGYSVCVYSTCTGFGGYWKDDRVVGHNLKKLISLPEKFSVFMDEVDDEQLGREFSNCILTIGTRLHSAIISMNFGTPAFTIFYEHKSLGIIERVAESSFCLDIQDLAADSTFEKVIKAIKEIQSLKNNLNPKIEKEKVIATAMIQYVLNEEKSHDELS